MIEDMVFKSMFVEENDSIPEHLSYNNDLLTYLIKSLTHFFERIILDLYIKVKYGG